MHRCKTPSLSLREESSCSVHQACSYLPRAAPCSAGGWLHTQVALEKSPGCAEGQCQTAVSQLSSVGEEEREMVRLLIHIIGAKALRLEDGNTGAVPILGLAAAFQGTATVVASS